MWSLSRCNNGVLVLLSCASLLFSAVLADKYHRELLERLAKRHRIENILDHHPHRIVQRRRVFPTYTIPAYYSAESNARSKRQAPKGNEEELEGQYWITQAQQRLQEQLTKELNFNIAKNVIMFLGDGMSIPTLSAARAYMGKLEGSLSGEETHLFFDDFPHSGLSKVTIQ